MTLPASAATPVEPESLAAEWWTIEQTADWLAVKRKLVYRLVHEDVTFPATKIGGRIRIRRSRLERWLDQRHPARPRRASKGSKNPCPRPEESMQPAGSQGET